ncbi:glutamate mutase epsilon subunit [Sphingopyxis sp. OAS728]|uniref:conjugal transfer protein TraD n=1 Tax=Sphingopyxis sp. OAS728 TaxID=2663823 RepID=UPI001A0FD1ED|nr:glutamate mutase epsilon subunit [Sphingopyxis sp. OAS728]
MRAIHLQQNEHVGTTYKRALTRFHRARDHSFSQDFSYLNGTPTHHSWFVLHSQMEGQTMRKPRDFAAELQALTEKAKALKTKKQGQLGELVITTGADGLSIEQLAGALLDAVGSDAARKEAWRKSGAAFFCGDGARARKGVGRNAGGASAIGASPQSASGEAGAA